MHSHFIVKFCASWVGNNFKQETDKNVSQMGKFQSLSQEHVLNGIAWEGFHWIFDI